MRSPLVIADQMKIPSIGIRLGFRAQSDQSDLLGPKEIRACKGPRDPWDHKGLQGDPREIQDRKDPQDHRGHKDHQVFRAPRDRWDPKVNLARAAQLHWRVPSTPNNAMSAPTLTQYLTVTATRAIMLQEEEASVLGSIIMVPIT
jgi:hypothetical protein